MVPEMGHGPGPSHIPTCPYRFSLPEVTYRVAHGPDIRIMARGPSLIHPVKCLCRDFPGPGKVADKRQERSVHFGEVGRFRQPVIFLRVTIHSVVAAPGRPYMGIPYPL